MTIGKIAWIFIPILFISLTSFRACNDPIPAGMYGYDLEVYNYSEDTIVALLYFREPANITPMMEEYYELIIPPFDSRRLDPIITSLECSSIYALYSWKQYIAAGASPTINPEEYIPLQLYRSNSKMVMRAIYHPMEPRIISGVENVGIEQWSWWYELTKLYGYDRYPGGWFDAPEDERPSWFKDH